MTRSYPEPMRVTGPLLSLVLRTEDVWQRHNQFFIEECGGSQSGFPLLTPILETYDGPTWRLMATPLSAPFQGFARRSGIQVFRLYSTPSPVTEIAMEICDGEGFPFSPLQCRQFRIRTRGGGWFRGNVNAACSGCVVFLVTTPDYNW